MLKATYVSVWDGGHRVETPCSYDPSSNIVSGIDTMDGVDDLQILEDEFVLLDDEQEIRIFYNSDIDQWVGIEAE